MKYAEFSTGMPIPIEVRTIRQSFLPYILLHLQNYNKRILLQDTIDFSAYEGCTKIKGTIVYGGFAVGRACVITKLSEAQNIQSGDILITHSTDVGWTPYFELLGGIVTELGGLISHGAVVARERGLTCIIGAKNATKVFQTGNKHSH